MKDVTTKLLREVPRLAFLAVLASALSGCIVVPPPYHYHPWYGYYR